MKETPNFNYLSQFSGGDKAFEMKMLAIVKSEFPVEREVYNENFKAKDFIKAAENVHKIKHKISILGLEKSHKLATKYENALREGNDELASDFDEIMQNIADFLETI